MGTLAVSGELLAKNPTSCYNEHLAKDAIKVNRMLTTLIQKLKANRMKAYL